MKRPKLHFTTKDLVTIALLSALGGALSTYIGYLGNLVNHIVGVPFGAGQFLAGLHVLWIMLALGITRKKGAATATGLLKGIVELFMGSTHGIVIVVVSLVQGLIPDLVLFSDKAKGERGPVMFALAGGFSAMSNVLVFQAFFFSGIPFILIAVLCMLAFASGMVFGGWLSIEMLESLDLSGLVPGRKGVHVDVPEEYDKAFRGMKADRRRRTAAMAVVVAFLTVFTVGGVYYFTNVYTVAGSTVEVTGAVSEPYDFLYADHTDHEVMVNAELIGSVTHVAPQDYIGIPLNYIVSEAGPDEGADEIIVWGSDGYSAVFSLDAVMADDTLILILEEDDEYRLVAAEYEGAYWVEQVVTVEVR
jgi:energy-coupling factor transport system substrate-specific component